MAGEFKYHKTTVQFIAWAAQKMIQNGDWTSDLPEKMVLATPRVGPKVAITGHELWRSDSRNEWRCRLCGRVARTPASLNALLTSKATRECAPSAIQRAASQSWFQDHRDSFVRVRCEAVQVACDAAAKLALEAEAQAGQGSGPEPPEAPLEPDPGAAGGEDFSVYDVLGHDVFRVGSHYCCRKCGALGTESRRVKLATPCLGFSEVASTKANQKQAIRRLEKGLHPRTGAALTF